MKLLVCQDGQKAIDAIRFRDYVMSLVENEFISPNDLYEPRRFYCYLYCHPLIRGAIEEVIPEVNYIQTNQGVVWLLVPNTRMAEVKAKLLEEISFLRVTSM